MVLPPTRNSLKSKKPLFARFLKIISEILILGRPRRVEEIKIYIPKNPVRAPIINWGSKLAIIEPAVVSQPLAWSNIPPQSKTKSRLRIRANFMFDSLSEMKGSTFENTETQKNRKSPNMCRDFLKKKESDLP
jgi:hypothetical protein